VIKIGLANSPDQEQQNKSCKTCGRSFKPMDYKQKLCEVCIIKETLQIIERLLQDKKRFDTALETTA
jgi:hypothetical protein